MPGARRTPGPGPPWRAASGPLTIIGATGGTIMGGAGAAWAMTTGLLTGMGIFWLPGHEALLSDLGNLILHSDSDPTDLAAGVRSGADHPGHLGSGRVSSPIFLPIMVSPSSPTPKKSEIFSRTASDWTRCSALSIRPPPGPLWISACLSPRPIWDPGDPPSSAPMARWQGSSLESESGTDSSSVFSSGIAAATWERDS